MKLKLESISTNYNAYDDRVVLVETYVPAERGEDWQVRCDGDVSYVTRRVNMRHEEFDAKKLQWKVAGVKIVDSRGEVVE